MENELLQEIGKGLHLEELPAQDQRQPSATAKFFFTLKEFVRKQNEEDSTPTLDKVKEVLEEIGKGLDLQELPAQDQPQPSATAKFFFSLKEFVRKQNEEDSVPTSNKEVAVEIDRVLGLEQLPHDEQDRLPGYEIGKSLRSLKYLDKENELLQEIGKGLHLEELPAQDQRQPSATAKFFFTLKEFVRKQNEEDSTPTLDKAFVAHAKNTAIAYASAFNALNVFGTTLSYLIRDYSHRIKRDPRIHAVFITLTMIFIPISMINVGVASALEKRIKWIDMVAWMLLFQTVYMGVMCGLFGYYLVDASPVWSVVLLSIVGTLSIAIPPWVIFRRPKLWSI